MTDDAPVPSGDDSLPVEIPSTPDERNLALLSHLGGAFFGFIVPLIVWLIKKEESRYLDDQAKEALNFQLTLLIVHLVGAATICFTFFIINFAAYVIDIVFGIMAAMAVSKGEVYRYPLNIRFIK